MCLKCSTHRTSADLLNLTLGKGSNSIQTKTHLYEAEWGNTLSESQQDAINAVIGNATTPGKKIHRIEGPPGCGKSKVVAELVARVTYEMRKNGEKKKIAVMTPTNTTAEDNTNNISRVQMPNKTQVRTTWAAARQQVDKILSEARHYITANLAVNNPDYNTYPDPFADKGMMDMLKKLHSKKIKAKLSTEEQSRYKILHKQAVKRMFHNAEQVTATACQMGIEIMRADSVSWKMIIIEEASMHTEIATMLALRLHPEQIVLIGDSKQLAARQLSEEAQKFKLMPLFNRTALSPYNNLIGTTMLKEHKRMPNTLNQSSHAQRASRSKTCY